MEDDESYSQFAVGNPSGGGKGKVLGINLDSNSDKISFNLRNDFAQSLPPTKPSVLKLAAKIFDPLGCLSLELNKSKSPIYVNQFNLFIDEEEVLRGRTQIKNAQARDSTKKRILFPSRNL